MHRTKAMFAALVLASIALAGCKATPAPDSGFLDDSGKMQSRTDSPFAKGYWNREVSQQKYTRIYVAPVNTKYVMAQNIWEGASAAQARQEDIRKALNDMGLYMQDAFKKAAAEDPRRRLVVADKPGTNTVVLDVKSLSWWAPCNSVIDTWAKQFIELANNPGKKIADAKKFELLVW